MSHSYLLGEVPTLILPAMLVRVIFVSERQAVRMKGRATAAVISITNPASRLARLSSKWHSVLRLEFDDVDAITFPNANPELQRMTHSQAKDIGYFISALPSLVTTLVVHCQSGISRSAGVAKAVADGHGLSFANDYKEYNRYVYELVLNEICFVLASVRGC